MYSCVAMVFTLSVVILSSSAAYAAPQISSLSPATGAVGAAVTIKGTAFGATQGTSTVTFNGTTATAIGSWSATTIVATVPTGATTGNVVVTVGGSASNGVSFTVVAAPSITSLSPTSAAVGAAVTITGTNFGATKGTSTVTFNGTTATTIGTWSATSIKVAVPTGATTGNVVVNASGVSSNGVAFTVLGTPSITSLSPTGGPVGSSVTITGTNFGATQGSSTVKFNGTTATTIGSWSTTSIVATVPAGATTGNVVVNASGVNSNGVAFTVLPTITSLTPATGAVGAAVTIKGTAFGATQGTSAVAFNGTTATAIGSWSATTIVATVPTGATTGDVVVTVGGNASNGVSFTVVAAPSITSLSPTSGAVGAPVTITGTNFGATKGSGKVTFNGTTAATPGWSATLIKATVPTGATTGNVVVYASGVNSNGVNFTVLTPSITTLSPTSGLAGTSVTISGANFGATQGSSTITFNATVATAISSWGSGQIVAVVPTGATTGPVVVTVGGVASNGVTFTVGSQAPSITSLSPNLGAIGTVVTISGNNFGSTQGSSTVTFNGTAGTPSSWSNTSIQLAVPTGATTGMVLVTVGGIGSNGLLFTIGTIPTLTSLSPTSGAVGASVTLTGTNFGSVQSNSQVTFNGVAAPVTSWSPTLITAQVPVLATTGKVVVTVLGLASNGISFTVTSSPGPSILSIAPPAGLVGSPVTINGSNFGATQGTSTVTFNGTPAVTTWWSSGLIMVIVPAAATTGNVVVTYGGVASNGVPYSVGAAPIITYSGSGIVGQTSNVSGTGFGSTQGSSTIAVNGTPVTPTTWNSTQISYVVPTNIVLGNTNTVVVTVNGLPSNAASLLGQPSITSINPPAANPGASITINGTSFGATQGGSSINFAYGVNGTPTSWSNTAIVVPVPSSLSPGYYTLQVNGVWPGGSTQSSYFAFMVGSPPTITSLSPNAGPPSSTTTINGTNFAGGYGGKVTFNGVNAAFTVTSSTSITATVPANATTGNVIVNDDQGGDVSNGVPFTVTSTPYISSLSPSTGGIGSSIEVFGSNFGSSQGSSTVTLNGTAIAAGNIEGWSSNLVYFTVPTGATSGNVVVTVGGVASNAVALTVNSAPTITLSEYSQAYIGESISFEGYSFGATQGSSTVTIGGISATATYWSPTDIDATVPNGVSTGTNNIVVNVGGVNSNSQAITIIPGITSISPTSGPVGTVVTISGSNFGATQGSSTIYFGSITGTPSTWNNTQIVVPVPTGATSNSVHVSVGSINSNYSYFYVGTAPTLTSISPTSGQAGIYVTLSGANFGTGGSVSFNGTTVGYYSPNGTQTTVAVPAGATTGNVTVTPNGIAASNGVSFTVTPGPGITYMNSPNGQTNPAGAVGASTYIIGAGFGTTQGSSTVTFGGAPATPTSWSATEIVVPIPAGAATGNVVVTVGGIASNGLPFSVTPTPTLTSVSPTVGGPNTWVTITGNNFGTSSSGGVLCYDGNCPFGTIQSWSSTQVVVQVNPYSLTNGTLPYDVNVSVYVYAAGVSSNSLLFTVLPPPSIVSISPTSGNIGTVVTLTGSGFGPTQSNSTVSFNGEVGTPTTWTNNTIVVPVPTAGVNGTVTVTVNGVPANAPSGFTLLPVITSISPTSGTLNQPVTIYGNGFGPTINAGATGGFYGCGGGSVNFNGSGSHPFTWSPTQITAPVPNNATTGLLTMSTCGGTSNGFTFTIAPNTSGTISGTVTNVLTTAPVAGITVAAQQSGSTVGSAVTATNGTYSIANLPAGTYNVQGTGSGYVTVLITGSSVTSGESTTVNLVLSTTPQINSVSPIWGGVGTVVTISGANFGPSQAASTGSVTFNGVPATPSSWNSSTITVPVPAGSTTGPVVVTVGGVPSTGVTFSVGGGSMGGTVTNASNGQAVNGASVQALLAHVVQGTATTSSNGSYTIANLGPGTYDVVVSASGLGATVTTGQVVTIGNTTTINVALPTAGTDSGSVTNGTSGISNATVSALLDGDVVATTTTNSSGSFTISNLSADTYSIQATAQGYTPQTTNGVSITAGNTTTTNFVLSGQSTLTYEYDALGRLVGVVDSLNGSGVYNYDAVGNVTSIQRLSVGQVSVTSFSPTAGIAGTTVTINGTNFSSTPSQDSVTFNGVSATVNTATTTQLTVTVPSAATSGPVKVTAPGGTGTSSSSFTVWTAANNPAPSITAISPTLAATGQTVTITGTNFDPNPVNDGIFLDGQTTATAASATTTSLTFVVPTNSPTGPVSVSNSAGLATSSNYLFVVPSPNGVSSVGYTGQINSIPGNQTVGLAANQIGILAFNATAGTPLTLVVSTQEFPNGCSVPATLIGPAGVSVYSDSCFGWYSGATQETASLPETGTYALVLGPNSGSAGSENIAVENVLANVTGYLWLNGSAGPTVPVTLQSWGQDARFTFNATAQQTATVHITTNTLPGMNVIVYGPNGTELASTSQGGSSFTLSVGTLPTTGSYLVDIVPDAGSQYVGSFNLSVTSP
jgi:YD repeat-containing protein